MTPLDAALELQGLPPMASRVPSGGSFGSEAPLSHPTQPPREGVASLPWEPAPAPRRLAPWIAIAAVAGIGIGLLGRGAVSRDGARGTALATPAAQPPAAHPVATTRATASDDAAVAAAPAAEARPPMAGIAETSAIARPSGTWPMPVPGARGTAQTVPAAGPASPVAPPAAGEEVPSDAKVTATETVAASPETTPETSAPESPPVAPDADNLANPYPSSEVSAPVGTEDEPATPTEDEPTPASDVPFDRGAAMVALATATATAAGCRAGDDPTGTTRVAVTFAPSGRVTQATVSGPPYAGTKTGGCIAQAFRGVSIGPFQGDPVTVTKSVSIR